MEETLLLEIISLCLLRFKKKAFDVRGTTKWLIKRGIFSHVNLFRELRCKPNNGRNYLKMDEDTYLKLLRLVSPQINKQNTCIRRAITPHKRLTATLSF